MENNNRRIPLPYNPNEEKKTILQRIKDSIKEKLNYLDQNITEYFKPMQVENSPRLLRHDKNRDTYWFVSNSVNREPAEKNGGKL